MATFFTIYLWSVELDIVLYVRDPFMHIGEHQVKLYRSGGSRSFHLCFGAMDGSSRKRARSGGHKQRVEEIRAQQVLEEQQKDSCLAEHLLYRWAWGEISAQDVQCISKLVLEDIAEKRDLRKLEALAAAGGYGKYSNKVYAAVLKVAAPEIHIPSPFTVKLPFKNPFGLILQAMILPHILFATIYRSYRETWEKVICPSTEAVTSFWQEMVASGNPNITPELKNKKNFRSRCIPLCLHGDGVPVSGLGKGWVQTVTNWSWYSLLATHAATADSLFFVCAIYDKLRQHGKDLNATAHHFLTILRWSFECLFTGKWPERDYLGRAFEPSSVSGRRAGKPLAGGWFATLWSVVGDLEYFASIMDVPRSRAIQPCSRCKCSKWGPLTWQDFNPNAAWISTVFTPASWRALPADQKSTCPLFSMAATSITNLSYDFMHSKFLGSDKTLYAAILWLLVFHLMPGPDEHTNLRTLWSEIKELYKAWKVESGFRYLNRVSMFWRPTAKLLTLRGKAAEIRSLARPLLTLWARYMKDTIEVHRKVHVLLKLNWRIEELLDLHKFAYRFPAAAAANFRDSMNGMLLLQQQLKVHFEDNEPKLFVSTEKSHFLQHLALESHCLSPRMTWCFSGEDFQRRVQTLMESCTRGQAPGQASVKMASRYRIALHLQFERHRL